MWSKSCSSGYDVVQDVITTGDQRVHNPADVTQTTFFLLEKCSQSGIRSRILSVRIDFMEPSCPFPC